MRELVVKYLSKGVSRRGFVTGLTKAGLTMTAAQSVLASVSTVSYGQTGPPADSSAPAPQPRAAATRARPRSRWPVKAFQGTGGAMIRRAAHRLGREIRVRQLGERGRAVLRSARRPPAAQIHPHAARGPRRRDGGRLHQGVGRAGDRDAGRASVGMVNAIGQMFNAYKEQTPLVVYSYRSDQSRRAGRDGFEEVAQPGADRPADHQVHLAGAPPRHDPGDGAPRLQGGVDAALRPVLHLLALRLQRRARAAPRSSRRISSIRACACGPTPQEVERAAKLLVEAKMPLMIVGDEIYKAKAVAKAVKLAELLGMPVTQVRQLYANFPEAHPLWVGNLAGGNLDSLPYPKDFDVVINVGNKFQHNGPAPDRAARSEVHRHAHRQLEHGQCDAHRGAAGRRCRLRARRPDRRGRATAHRLAQAEGRGAHRRGQEVQRRKRARCARRSSTARTGTRRR